MYYVASADHVFEYVKIKKQYIYYVHMLYMLLQPIMFLSMQKTKLIEYELVISGCDNSSIQSINELTSIYYWIMPNKPIVGATSPQVRERDSTWVGGKA